MGLFDGIADYPNQLANKIGTPGSNNYQATPYQVDPNAYVNPYLTADANTVGSQANLNKDVAGLTTQMGTEGYGAANAGLTDLAGNLQATAHGAPGTSIAEQRLANDMARSNANAMGMASAAGGNPALALKTALDAQGANNLGAASNAAMAGIAERNAANGQLANVYGTQGNLGLGQQNVINSATQGLTGEAMGAQNAAMGAQIAKEGQNSANYNAAQGINAGISQANAQNNANLFGGLMGAGGSVLTGLGLAEGGVTGGIGDAMTAFANNYTHTTPPAAPKVGAPGPESMISKLFGGAGGAADAGAGVGATGSGAAGLAGGAAMLAAANGAIVPGVDHGVDESVYALRPNEVVMPPENPLHPIAKRAVKDPGFAAGLARHLLSITQKVKAATAAPSPEPTPVGTAGVGG